MGAAAWTPDEHVRERAQLTPFLRSNGLRTFAELHQFSVTNIPAFDRPQMIGFGWNYGYALDASGLVGWGSDYGGGPAVLVLPDTSGADRFALGLTDALAQAGFVTCIPSALA